jgi:hypothetical protein
MSVHGSAHRPAHLAPRLSRPSLLALLRC